MSDRRPNDRESDKPATLHRAMREAIGRGLKARYQVPREVPHAFLVLLMQINEKRRKEKPVKHRRTAANSPSRLRSLARV